MWRPRHEMDKKLMQHTRKYMPNRHKGDVPQFFILDNEISSDSIDVFQAKEIQYQLVPPEFHRHTLGTNSQ